LKFQIPKSLQKYILNIFKKLSFNFESIELEKIAAEKIIDIAKEYDVPLYKARR